MNAKRALDLSLTIPGLIILSPIMAMVAIAIKIDSKGPVFFRQERIGQYGRPFKIIKFRTMVEDAEKLGPKITTSKDQRITRVGRILRKYKIDELPQIINVILGDMSLVGPRPEVQEYIEYYPEEAKKKILSVPPGITDIASIKYINENEILSKSPDPKREYIKVILPRKIKLYLNYTETMNIALDLKIIILTIKRVFNK